MQFISSRCLDDVYNSSAKYLFSIDWTNDIILFLDEFRHDFALAMPLVKFLEKTDDLDYIWQAFSLIVEKYSQFSKQHHPTTTKTFEKYENEMLVWILCKSFNFEPYWIS